MLCELARLFELSCAAWCESLQRGGHRGRWAAPIARSSAIVTATQRSRAGFIRGSRAIGCPAASIRSPPPAGRKRRLGPIFRDREELPASEDLSASVRAALAASDVLVVLCSPEARASRWVAREIELFREIGPDRPILAAIVRGEPGEAFPARCSRAANRSPPTCASGATGGGSASSRSSPASPGCRSTRWSSATRSEICGA